MSAPSWSTKIRMTNDEIADFGRRLEVDPDMPMAFLCECDPPCGGFVHVSRHEYQRLRRTPEPLVLAAHARAVGDPADGRTPPSEAIGLRPW